MPPFARWNPARDVWETDQASICGHWEGFSGTWPRSGMTRAGTALPLPASEHHTDDSGSSSLLQTPLTTTATGVQILERQVGGRGSLLPTPRALDSTGVRGQTPNRSDEDNAKAGLTLTDVTVHLLPTPTTRDHKGANQRGDDTCLTGALLPTPRATDGTKGGPNQRGSSGDLMLPSAVMLLPTPSVADGMGGHMTRSGARSNELLLPGVARSIGASTNQPSADGKAS